ncbi:MAG: hypothetical protein LC754_19080, partial [Acidobacteria bacterium]|nr:hypothetical protein [Acidobacteriota bacterium]
MYWNFSTNSCQADDPTSGGGGACDGGWDCTYGNPLLENNSCCDASPILIDVTGNGFTLTDKAGGVIF